MSRNGGYNDMDREDEGWEGPLHVDIFRCFILAKQDNFFKKSKTKTRKLI